MALFSQYHLYQVEILQKNVGLQNQSSIISQIEDLLTMSAKKAQEAFEAVEAAHLKDSEILPLEFYDGWLYLIKGNSGQAFELLKRAAQHAEEYSLYERLSFVYYLLGQAAEKLGDYAEAKAAYRRALDLDTNLNNGFWQSLTSKRLRGLLKTLD